jgi:hypothetical protein
MHSTVMEKQRMQSDKESGKTLYNIEVAGWEEAIQDVSWNKSGRGTEVSVCETEQIFRRETDAGESSG